VSQIGIGSRNQRLPGGRWKRYIHRSEIGIDIDPSFLFDEVRPLLSLSRGCVWSPRMAFAEHSERVSGFLTTYLQLTLWGLRCLTSRTELAY
jgi:hypothetical protein